MSKLINCIKKKDSSCVPVWFMRQAGRYLPEFREIRKKNPNFIKLCLDTDLSSEITLQPIKRFDLDAAIIFSDILMVPYALGQNVKFTGDGPELSNFNLRSFLKNDKINFTQKLHPIYKAIEKTKKKLSREKSLVAFVGAPWTLLVYMMGLKKNKNEINLEKLKGKDFEVNIILDKLNEYLSIHIENQINAGADVIQIFDSWAGLLPKKKLPDYCFIPNLKIVDFCKKSNIANICFPRGIKESYLEFLQIVKPDCLSLDYEINPEWANKNLSNVCLQGGMSPHFLFKKEEEINKEVDRYLNIFKDKPYIFNLGHGLTPETDPDVLKKVIERVRLY
jgi:uroporphyrinogen decarboxylase